MISFDLLAKGFQSNSYLSIHTTDQTLVANRRKKNCCFSSYRSQTIRKECKAVRKALDWLKHNHPTDQHHYQNYRTLYRGVSRRLKTIRGVNHGFLGRIVALFKGKQIKQEIRKLENLLDNFLQTMRKGSHLANSLFSQIESSDVKDERVLFRQIASELSGLTISKNPTAHDFGLSAGNREPRVPLLLKREKRSGYTLFLPPLNGSSCSIQLRSIRDLHGAFQSYRYKELFEQCQASSTSLDEITHPISIREVVDKLHFTLNYDRNNPFNSAYTLVAHSYNILTGCVETSELLLDATQNERSIRAWRQQIVNANLARLQSVDELLIQYEDFEIQADLLTRTLHAQVDINLSSRHLKEVGLDAQAFSRLSARIHAYQANNKFYTRQWPILNKRSPFNQFSINRCTSYIGPCQERFYQISFKAKNYSPIETLLKVKESENLEESFFREFKKKFSDVFPYLEPSGDVEQREVSRSRSR